ncbi:MAG: c-type cytochrome [Acidobacteria bacterium]|nr:c-type cytochrome [Acidobacteriota bacterium]
MILAAPVWAQEDATREAEEGRARFEQKCTVCHTNGGGDHIGPDLAGVTARRSREWLRQFILQPDRLLADGDAVAVELLNKYNGMPMPNLGLAADDVEEILAYLAGPGAGTGATGRAGGREPQPAPDMLLAQSAILYTFLAITALIVIVFAVVVSSTRTPTAVDVASAYRLRRVLFSIALVLVAGVAIVTLPRAPYAREGTAADRIVYVAARQYDFVFSDEPIVTADDIARSRRIESLQLPAGELVEFRVTSLDVTHGFGIYGPERQLLVQTQAMPGYVNRLLVRLNRPGPYLALCMEYCAGGHHLMQASFTVDDAKPIASHRTQPPSIAR